MIIAGTGHRPEYFGGYELVPSVVEFLVEILPSYNPTRIITGMAAGYDQALARAAIIRGIPFIAAVPFEGQESHWPDEIKQEYYNILKHAADVVVVSQGGYAGNKYRIRDRWMVDNANGVLAFWSGVKKGGTYDTVRYAERVNKPVNNVWPGWVSQFPTLFS